MSRHLLLEDHYDSGRWEAVNRAVWPEACHLVDLVLAERWDEARARGRELFFATEDLRERAFILHWIVSASELEYDLDKRAAALSLWSELTGWASDPYCSFLRALHDGISRFFAGSLRDAEASFRVALDFAFAATYERGQMVALFHLGLTEHDRGNRERAHDSFTAALAIARARGASNYANRIQVRLTLAAQGAAASSEEFARGLACVEERLARGDHENARRELLALERARRSRGFLRGRESIGCYLGLVHLLAGRERLGRRLFAKIADPVVKLRLLTLKRTARGLSSEEEREVTYLRDALGASVVVKRNANGRDDVEIGGVPLSGVADEAVKKFLLLLVHAGDESVSKEAIVSGIWNLNYDPVVHDNKLYKLVQKAKRLFGASDLVVNRYGSYQLNPRLRGGSQRGA
jgi:hypothetical protein